MKKDKRPTLGVLIGFVNTGYYKSILSGILDFVREHDLNLHCFATSLINSTGHWGSDKNILFSMVDKANVDGLIVIATALETYVGREARREFITQYRSINLASIGSEIPGAPSFIIDNSRGMLDLLAHLTDHHGYRRLACITGPLANSEAALRFDTYRRFLDSRRIPYDPALVAEGDFTGESGKEAVRRLLRERSVKADVIIAANDMMAFGAIEELTSWGLQVPGDAFVVGFDDIEMSANANLTTVRQPLYEQGYESASALFRLLRGETPSPLTILPTEPVIRESCGCPSGAFSSCRLEGNPGVGAQASTGENERQSAASVMKDIVRLKPAGGGIDLRPWIQPLLDAFARSLAEQAPELFIVEWKKLLFAATTENRNTASLQLVISVIRAQAVGRNHWAGETVYAENVLHQARVLVDEALRRENAVQSIEAEIQEEHFSNIDLGLSRVGNLDEQLNIIYTEFPALGLRSCYLSLFDDQLAHPDRARLILAYEDHRRIDLPARGISFSARELIPASLFPVDRRHNFVVKALAHRDKNLGFILMEMGDNVRFAGIFDYLCPKLTSVLQLAIFIEKTVRQAEDLDRANKQLGETNQALEEFAFMASHDLQEPLRKILVFGDRLAGTGKDVLTEQGKDYLARMENAAVRMQTLIDSLLAYSRVSTTNTPFSTVDLNQVIKGVLSDLDATIEATHARVEAEDLPAINADPVQMSQLFRNLIGNAIKFQPPGAQPLVRIYREPGGAEGEIAIAVEDNGIGIENKYHEKIFVVFQRLHTHQQYEGNGIGLAICKKIAERHNAAISVESEPGRGTKIILRFRGKRRLTTDEHR